MGGCQLKLPLHDGGTGCFRYSLLYSKRAQPHSLGLTSMLPQLIDSTSGTAQDIWPAQCLEIDADGVLGVTCQSWPRYSLDLLGHPLRMIWVRVGYQVAQYIKMAIPLSHTFLSYLYCGFLGRSLL